MIGQLPTFSHNIPTKRSISLAQGGVCLLKERGLQHIRFYRKPTVIMKKKSTSQIQYDEDFVGTTKAAKILWCG